MQCKNCGANVPDDSAFCSRCGAKLSATAPPAGPGPLTAPAPAAAPEQPVWSGRYSVKAMGGWILLLGAVGVSFVIAFVKLFLKQSEYTARVGWSMLIVFAGLAAWLLIVALMRKWTTRYRLTTQRLFVDKGIINKNVEEVELVRVDDVAVHQNIIERIFDVGDVKVLAPTDPSSPDVFIVGIANPVEVKEKIRNMTQELRKKSLRMEAI